MTPVHPDVLRTLDQRRPWIIMPILAHRDYTIAAIADCLQQSKAARLLLINQGVDNDFRSELERTAEAASDRILLWSHVPSLPSLSATWNRALDAAWAAGATEALVVNNDVRLRPWTLQLLQIVRERTSALFVSAVGVTREQFEAVTDWTAEPSDTFLQARGGPDFSCYLITKDCHTRYRFDEHFVPAFCEDLDYHRRLMLNDDGDRIFSVNLPYLHYASATLKALPDEQANAIRTAIETKSRAYYARKWGGPVNHERFYTPFDQPPDTDVRFAGMPDPPTTPALQAWCANPGQGMVDAVEAAEEAVRQTLREGVGDEH